jgi:hypothetical protein
MQNFHKICNSRLAVVNINVLCISNELIVLKDNQLEFYPRHTARGKLEVGIQCLIFVLNYFCPVVQCLNKRCMCLGDGCLHLSVV